MFALVDKSDNSITKMLNGYKGITIGDNQYPRAIFTLWTEAERNAINIYTVTIDNSKKKDERWYINTNITYSFDGTNATGSYGDATAKAHADITYTNQDKTDGTIPSAITTHRDAVRSKQAAMETSITNASDTPALETLYTPVNTADEGDPIVMARPLGELPTL